MIEDFKLFDPEAGVTIVAPEVDDSGWWAGAPAGFLDEASGDLFLSYRLRRPRGQHPDRGAICHVARSADGIHFETVWSMEKSSLQSTSLERSDIVRFPDGRWSLFISYVDGANNQWRTDVIEADDPTRFDPAARRKLFVPAELGLAAVKDPVVVRAGSAWLMYLSCAVPRAARTTVDHSTADAYDTGTILSHTGLATSFNGKKFEWQGMVLNARDDGRWDSYSARIAAVVPAGGKWLAFYDGAYGVDNHYDETTGLAISTDLRTWRRLTPEGPALAAPGDRCLRYLDVIPYGDELLFYYEYGRPDGSHELRLNRVPSSVLDSFG